MTIARTYAEYIQSSEPDKLYTFREKLENIQLWEGEDGKLAWPTLKVEDLYMEIHSNAVRIYRRDEIRMRNGICFLGNRKVLIGARYWSEYFIYRRYADGKRFILSDSPDANQYEKQYDMYYDGENPPVVKRRVNKFL